MSFLKFLLIAVERLMENKFHVDFYYRFEEWDYFSHFMASGNTQPSIHVLNKIERQFR